MANLTFLEAGPTRDRLLRAVAANHVRWFSRCARAGGGETRRETGVTWVYTPAPCAEASILFPQLEAETGGERLDAILEDLRRRKPAAGQVGCWSLEPEPRDLGTRLAARGFRWGWQPHWMWLDFRNMCADFPTPSSLRIGPVESAAAWKTQDLPYYHRDTAPRLDAVSRLRPQRVWRFAARLEDALVGQGVLHLTAGPLGVAGIYDVGVVPSARNQGIGKALTLTACQFAQGLGCRHGLLNATPLGEPVYRRLGFETIGHGQTWWLSAETLASPPPLEEVALAEAVGRGDLATLDSLAQRLEPRLLNQPLACGETPLQLAVRAGQADAAGSLVRHGATLDVISAWDLGWKEQVPQLLARSPELANHRSGEWQITPLHVAAERGDLELAHILLDAGPDLEIQDTQFHSTPLGWARHFQRTEMIELIEQHETRVRNLV